jgi:Fe-S cluster biogenesis protein NfuA/nitrite reductase/ring-hydroxylating ferredoxin subunit
MTVTDDQASATDQPGDFELLAGAVDDAIAAVDGLDDDAGRAARDLKDAIEAFHKPALVAIVQRLRDDPRGKEILFELVDDPAVRAVFALHGIIRADPVTRANQALAVVRPYLQSHGGDVELVRIENRAAFVRLHGSCNGCSMSAVTLRDGVEEALVRLPEIDRVEVLDDETTTAFIPVESIGRKPGADPDAGWVKGPAAEAVSSGSMLRFDVAGSNGSGAVTDNVMSDLMSFVITNTEGRFAVFRNACVHQGLTLDGGMIDDGVIVCPWHGFRFDALSGECVSAPGAQLEQVPTRLDDGHVWIRTGGA